MKTIAHITDLHLDEQFPIDQGVKARENIHKILEDVKKRNVDEVIFTGDIGTPESNRWFFHLISKYGFDLKITLGNHDTFVEAAKYFAPDQLGKRSELYYSLQDNNFKYIFLDSSSGNISQAQKNWFLDELKTNKPILLFIHHPILETHTTPQREYPLKSSQQLCDHLKELNSLIYIFCGHIHMKDERKEGNVSQFVTPAACFQVKRNSETSEVDNINFGYRLIQIDEDKVSSEVLMFTPETIEQK